MINHPEQDTQQARPSSGKLILPAPLEPGPYARQYPPTTPAWSTQSVYPQNTPHDPSVRPTSPRRRDPLHLVFALAIAFVLIATIVFVAFGATVFLNKNTTTFSQTPVVPIPNGTVDNRPGFGTPGTNNGSNQSSQPATGPTPSLHLSPSPANQGSLVVQIVNIPRFVANNSKARVSVLTNEPGVNVRLQVTYSAAPFFYASSAHATDGDGQAVLSWSVRVFALRNNAVQATVRAIATDQNGQQATSQPVVVIVGG
ncbi:MAG TPA: hypothetical protein VFV38_42015 [Ktedonobacteraceae bacterium]|nr:hypothetical protein [Ktedonobacteraceae bacterium]